MQLNIVQIPEITVFLTLITTAEVLPLANFILIFFPADTGSRSRNKKMKELKKMVKGIMGLKFLLINTLTFEWTWFAICVYKHGKGVREGSKEMGQFY